MCVFSASLFVLCCFFLGRLGVGRRGEEERGEEKAYLLSHPPTHSPHPPFFLPLFSPPLSPLFRFSLFFFCCCATLSSSFSHPPIHPPTHPLSSY